MRIIIVRLQHGASSLPASARFPLGAVRSNRLRQGRRLVRASYSFAFQLRSTRSHAARAAGLTSCQSGSSSLLVRL